MTTLTDVPLSAIDLGDPDLWRDGPPYELFARLRREAPVHWSPLEAWPEEAGFWSITRAADIAAVSRDWQTFSNERGGFLMVDDIGLPLELMNMMFLAMDPPRHDRMKAIFQRAFTPKRIADHEQEIRNITNRAIDRIIEQGEGDLVIDVAEHVTARVIGSMLGTPEEDDAQIVQWANHGGAFEGDTDLRPKKEDAIKAVQEGLEYVVPRVAERRERPTGDLLSALANAEIDGEQFHEWELAIIFGLLIFAGTDTSKATFGSSMVAFCEDPEQRDLLIREPERMPHAVEECMRCFPPVSHMRRTTQREVEINGVTIPEGEKVLIWYVSGNRDETVYDDDPMRFDIRRDMVEHQSFGGGGRHYCLGASLARLELKVMFEEVLRRMPDVELAAPPVRVAQAVWMNQFKSVPVRFTPGPKELS